MIGRVLKSGRSVRRLLYYLYGPGRACEHVNPHLVGGWEHPKTLEPTERPDGRRDFRRLAGLLELPLALLGDQAPDRPVLHITVRAAPGDPDLVDGAWMAITAELMHRIGLSEYGHEDEGVRWVAVHHGDNHVHIAAILARQDGRRAHLHNDYYRIGEAMSWAEREYGLQAVARADRTANARPSRAEQEKARRTGRAEPPRVTLRRRAEQEKARRTGRAEPPRVTLRRQAAAAAAGARSEAEFFAGLEARGLMIRLRKSTIRPGEVTGYAVSLPGDVTASGSPVWYGGGKLAADLALPKLNKRWRNGPSRLSGRRMSGPAARITLRREVSRCAASARSEPEFWAALESAGLLVRKRLDPVQPGSPIGYAVSLPGMNSGRDGRPVWFGGGTLDDRLSLPALRGRWRNRQPGTPPGPEQFAGADISEIYAYVAHAAQLAARELGSAKPQFDVAWAAADLIAAAAEATGNEQLRRAADDFSRASRAPWGRIPRPSPGGTVLRTASYLLASCRPGGYGSRTARVALITALTGLALAVAEMRAQQRRLLQAAAAREATARLAAAAAQTPDRLSQEHAQFAARIAPRRVVPGAAAGRRPGPLSARRTGPSG